MIELIGWLGAQLLAWCAAPAAFEVFQQGHANGYNVLFLAMWGLGEVFTAVYVYLKHGIDKPLHFNYAVNLFFITFILIYVARG